MRLRLVAALALGIAAAPASVCIAASPSPRAIFLAERAAVGGGAWSALAGIRTRGTQIAGGAPGTFVETVDHRTGFSRGELRTGPLHDVSGFDGTVWEARNGIVSQADLPGIVADGVTEAYMARDGWWNAGDPAEMTLLAGQSIGGRPADVIAVVPRGGSAVDVWIDRATRLIVRTVQHTDGGNVTTDYAGYRAVGRIRVPFRTTSVDPTNARTVTNAAAVDVLSTIAAADVARPAPQVRASFAGAPPAVVPFEFDAIDTGHIVVNATLAQRPATLIFDTGGANYVVPNAVKRLGLSVGGGASISGVGNESVAGGFANVGEIGLGSSKLADQVALAAPLPYLVEHPRAGMTVDGLLGFETLSAFRVTVDYAARTMTLEPFDATPPQGTVVRFVSEGMHAYVPVTIDGATGLFGIDTGDAGGLTVFRRFAREHGIFTGPGLQYVSAGGVGGTLGYAAYRGRSMTIAGTALDAPVVVVTDATAGSFASRAINGNIGVRVLERFRLTFDYRARTVTFAPNARVGERFSADRMGFSLSQQAPDAFVVLSVVTGSPADAAGVRAGDRIVEIDGKNVAAEHLGVGDVRPLLRDRTADLPLVLRRGTSRITASITPRELL
jgi:hypothetical protein